MKRSHKIFSTIHAGSSLFMMVVLLWLTISTPYVYAAQQIQKQQQKQQKPYQNNNPFSNTTEEKNENGVNTLSEYLHDFQLIEQSVTLVKKFYKCYPSNLYIEYHPELVSPPPEA
jgi:hypothetical protein